MSPVDCGLSGSRTRDRQGSRPPVAPGPDPFALGARYLVTNGIRRALQPFSPLELDAARASVERNGAAGILLVNGPIQANAITGSAFAFLRRLDLLRAAGATAFVVMIDSEGGDMREGFAMIRGIDRASRDVGPVIAYVKGLGASMASALAVAASYAVIDPFRGRLYVHEPEGGAADHLAILRGNLADLYVRRTLTDRDRIEGFMARGVALDPESARLYGFVDEVAGPERVAEIARAVAQPGGLWSEQIRAAGSWRSYVLRERKAAAEGCLRFGAGAA
jgi:ATP-dependent protease ClpP protease subunit